MRKTPNDNRELTHWWAAQRQPEATCGNMRYNGPVLYSYAEPIAVLLPDNRVLISNMQFSVTTSSHQSLAHQATNHMTRCSAPYLPGKYLWSGGFVSDHDWEAVHTKNRDYWIYHAEYAVAELKNHPRRKRSVADKIASAVQSYNHYREFFDLDWQELSSDTMRELVEEAAQQRVVEEARRLEREAQRLKEALIQEAEDLALWREHNTEKRVFTKTALRLTLDGKEIETTRGARVPVECAKYLWLWVQRAINTQTSYTPMTETKVGAYQLTRIEPNGTLVIGCHTIPYDELEMMAERLGYSPHQQLKAA